MLAWKTDFVLNVKLHQDTETQVRLTNVIGAAFKRLRRVCCERPHMTFMWLNFMKRRALKDMGLS